MTKVGIITMHKVWNAGSALQAYALQHIVANLGYDVELIDYVYPNWEHTAYQQSDKDFPQHSYLGLCKSFISQVKAKWSAKDPMALYYKFYAEQFNDSAVCYQSRKSLLENPPICDIYVTGSDQVWNPNYIGFDTNFFLAFAPASAKRISYASSFSVSSVPAYLREIYASELNNYSHLSVREASGKALVKELTGKEAEVCLDPTLLLDRKSWLKLADASSIRIDEPYLLIYIMGYAYSPYPDIYRHIEAVNKELNLPIVWLNGVEGHYHIKFRKKQISLTGPYEFLYLFANAAFVVTDSFHGTAFSLNMEREFISVVKSLEGSDSRMMNLLRSVGASSRARVCKEAVHEEEAQPKVNYEQVRENLVQLRKQSIEYLECALKE